MSGRLRTTEVLRTAWRNATGLAPILWREARWLLLGQAVLLLLQAALPAAGLLITRELVNLLTALGSLDQAGAVRLIRVAGLQMGVELLSVLLTALSSPLTVRLNQRMQFALQSALALKAAAEPLAEFDRPGFFDDLQRARTGAGQHVSGWLEGIFSLIRQVLTVGTMALVLGRISPYLALALLAVVVPFTLIQFQIGADRLAQFRDLMPTVRRADYFTELLTSRAAAKEVRLFGLAASFYERYCRFFWQNADEVARLRSKVSWRLFRMDVLGLAATVAILGAAMVPVLSAERMTPGDFLIVLQAILSLRGTAQSLGLSVSRLLDDFLAITDLLGFLDRSSGTAAMADSRQRFPTAIRNGIEVRGISFRYAGGDRPSLSDISFHIRPGERVALVGENGSGKSTLVKCLLGLYPVDAGAILVDGIPLNAIAEQDLRANMTAVFQDFMVYQLSVRDNVAAGCLRKADDTEQIWDALHKSGAAEFVARLPEGLETQLGHRFAGTDLSTGQWQKLAIARGYFGEGQVIVLDEPTAALDPVAEALLYEKFAELTREKTSLLVSHRLGICPLADRILVLKQGRLVEQGSHAELMALGGEYARMYARQADWYARDSVCAGRGGAAHAGNLAQ